MALDHSGHIWVWGENEDGQLGLGTYNDVDKPTRVVINIMGKRATKIACGAHFSMAVTAMGRLYTWGACSEGQLGLGSTQKRPTPLLVTQLMGQTIMSCAAGESHAAAITDNGIVSLL